MIDRKLEKTQLNGFLIYINYKGYDYYSFDEEKDKKTVKGYIKELLKKENIEYVKGIQQAVRTDKKVSANENILYIMTKKENIDELLKYEIVNKIAKTVAYLELPNLVEKRIYIFEYEKEKIKNSKEKIIELCEKLSGLKDFSNFTTNKGRCLKNQYRNIKIEYIDNKLFFIGDSFLPHQVRIMSSYILTNSKKELDGKYLTLDKVIIKKELEDMILEKTKLGVVGEVYSEISKKYTFLFV